MLRPSLLLILAVGALAGVIGAGRRETAPTGTAANRTSARRDAQALLAKMLLPPGAVRLVAEPRGDNGYLHATGVLVADAAHAVADQWWQVDGTPQQLMSYTEAHPPAGGVAALTGHGGNFRTGTSSLMVTFEWQAIPNVLGYRAVSVTATSIGGGRTGVLLESQSDWIVLRPASERIPLDVHSIQITSRLLGRPPQVSLSVVRPAEARRIVELLNGLPIAQPITYGCPNEMNPKVITMRFRSAKRTAVAVLTYFDFWPWTAPSGECQTIQLTLRGRAQTPLVGGYFLRTLAKLLGQSLT